MAKIILAYRKDLDKRQVPVPTYSTSFLRELKSLGHDVISIGDGHPCGHIDAMSDLVIKQHDLLIDLDCGRNTDGKLSFQINQENRRSIKIKTAVRFIDTHGYPSLHRRLAKLYNHCFFAVFRRRDLFSSHPSAHWAPCASDTH